MAESLDILTIDLENVDTHEAGILAQELREFVLAEDPGLRIERIRSDQRTQDLGATLVIVLGTGAALAIARGVQRWIGLRSTSKVVLGHGEDRLEVTNLSGWRAEQIVEKWIQSRQSKDAAD